MKSFNIFCENVLSLCQNRFFFHEKFSYDDSFRHLMCHTLQVGGRQLEALFFINIYITLNRHFWTTPDSVPQCVTLETPPRFLLYTISVLRLDVPKRQTWCAEA